MLANIAYSKPFNGTLYRVKAQVAKPAIVAQNMMERLPYLFTQEIGDVTIDLLNPFVKSYPVTSMLNDIQQYANKRGLTLAQKYGAYTALAPTIATLTQVDIKKIHNQLLFMFYYECGNNYTIFLTAKAVKDAKIGIDKVLDNYDGSKTLNGLQSPLIYNNGTGKEVVEISADYGTERPVQLTEKEIDGTIDKKLQLVKQPARPPHAWLDEDKDKIVISEKAPHEGAYQIW